MIDTLTCGVTGVSMRFRRLPLLLLLVAVALPALAFKPAVAQELPQYDFWAIRLEADPEFGDFSYSVNGTATARNEAYQIVGSESVDGYATGPVLYTLGRGASLDPLREPGFSAVAINERGQVIGGGTPGVSTAGQFIWYRGKTIPLTGLRLASDIDDRGRVIGNMSTDPKDPGSEIHAALWVDGELTDLGEAGTASSAYAIGEKLHIVGVSGTDIETPYGLDANAFPADAHATYWQGGETVLLGELPEADPATAFSFAYDINANDAIAGVSSSALGAGLPHATLWEDGEIIDLGALNEGWISAAVSINDSGVIVGWSKPVGAETSTPTIWIDRKPYQLEFLANSMSGWTLSTAVAICNDGAVVGTAYNQLGNVRGYVMSIYQ